MSWRPDRDPGCDNERPSRLIDHVITARARDLGGFGVRRVLPAATHRIVGPFVFFDHMGPASIPPGQGLDVRPHPHINLATVTYLFRGEIVHRDSLGTLQTIKPGAVNWMTAGRGIAHSERSSPEAREAGVEVHGIQLWVALPREHEEDEPSFEHYDASVIPCVSIMGATLRVIAGKAFGATSPVRVSSPMFYVDATIPANAEIELPLEYPDRAAYVVEGSIECDGHEAGEGTMLVFHHDTHVALRAREPSRVMLIGGEPLEGPRHIWWNFVSSSEARIERARRDWKEGLFAKVPGDEVEFIPLPET